MRSTMPPEIEEQLKIWNDARLETVKVRKEIDELNTRLVSLHERMDGVSRKLENILFNLEQPIGLKIGEDYVVVIQDPYSDDFTIQTVNFDLRQKIANS